MCQPEVYWLSKQRILLFCGWQNLNIKRIVCKQWVSLLQSQARTNDDMMLTCSRKTTWLYPYRSLFMWTGTELFRGENAVALAYYGSCRLLVMGSWSVSYFNFSFQLTIRDGTPYKGVGGRDGTPLRGGSVVYMTTPDASTSFVKSHVTYNCTTHTADIKIINCCWGTPRAIPVSSYPYALYNYNNH